MSQAEATFAAIKEKRAWDLAISPAKQLPMQAFMLYMSGGGVQIFSMGIVFMLLFSPFKNLANINSGNSFPLPRSLHGPLLGLTVADALSLMEQYFHNSHLRRQMHMHYRRFLFRRSSISPAMRSRLPLGCGSVNRWGCYPQVPVIGWRLSPEVP